MSVRKVRGSGEVHLLVPHPLTSSRTPTGDNPVNICWIKEQKSHCLYHVSRPVRRGHVYFLPAKNSPETSGVFSEEKRIKKNERE